MSDRRRRVFVVPGVPGESVARLDAEESHHVARVLRLRAGEEVEAFDGVGRAWRAKIESVERGEVAVRLGEPLAATVEPPVGVTLVQSFVRPEKLEYVLQKGTEIGVASFVLAPAARSEAPPPSPSRLARYRRIVLEACKQSGRVVVPGVEVGGLALEVPGLRLVLDGGAPLVLGAALAAPPSERVALAVGPEGGFDAEELAGLVQAGWTAVALGPRILRTETAGAVAAAIVLHLWGDLGGARPKTPVI